MDQIEKLESSPLRTPISRYQYKHRKAYYRHSKLPIRSFIRGCVGMHVNDVFSRYKKLEWLPEEYKNLARFGDYVYLDTIDVDGKIYVRASYIRGAYMRSVSSFNCVWVHPETGILHESRPKKYSWREHKPKDYVVLGDYHQLIKIKGIWYEVKGKRQRLYHYPKSHFNNVIVGPKDKMINGKCDLHLKITYKKQLSKEELKKFKLKND